MLIAITGADACGKDTQVAKLINYYNSKQISAQTISIWDSLKYFSDFEDQAGLKKILNSFLMKFEPTARSLFLMSCLKNSLDTIKKESEIVILNGYYFKYWATEVSYGVSHDFWRLQVSQVLPIPDKVIYLNADLETCLSRRQKWSSYEQGQARTVNHVFYDLKSYQTKVHLELSKVLSEQKKVHTIDANLDEQAVFESLVKHL